MDLSLTRQHMGVIGADAVHGIVDKVESARIKLTKDDSGGRLG